LIEQAYVMTALQAIAAGVVTSYPGLLRNMGDVVSRALG
jgi:hypothetical protein